MSHIRTQLRDAVIERLRTSGAFALTATKLRRGLGFDRDQFPLATVAVTDKSDTVGRGQIGQRPQTRTMTVEVRVALHLEDVDLMNGKLDDLGVTVEQLLADPRELGVGSFKEWSYLGSADLDDGMAEFGFVELPMIFTGTLSTLEGNPSANLHP
ncbi:hypothetical protein [Rhizobium pisi]|uniref:hypothetical protein n=1 Tax=Rhizobium pisi TaxID=574561 RepID=UPI003CFF3B80